MGFCVFVLCLRRFFFRCGFGGFWRTLSLSLAAAAFLYKTPPLLCKTCFSFKLFVSESTTTTTTIMTITREPPPKKKQNKMRPLLASALALLALLPAAAAASRLPSSAPRHLPPVSAADAKGQDDGGGWTEGRATWYIDNKNGACRLSFCLGRRERNEKRRRRRSRARANENNKRRRRPSGKTQNKETHHPFQPTTPLSTSPHRDPQSPQTTLSQTQKTKNKNTNTNTNKKGTAPPSLASTRP
jgi:hypothetical protein